LLFATLSSGFIDMTQLSITQAQPSRLVVHKDYFTISDLTND